MFGVLLLSHRLITSCVFLNPSLQITLYGTTITLYPITLHIALLKPSHLFVLGIKMFEAFMVKIQLLLGQILLESDAISLFVQKYL